MAAVAVGLCGAAADSPCPITPAPKVYRDFGSSWPLAAGEQVAIVVGRQVTEPERYAAERLQGLIQRRYQQAIPVLGEDKVPAAARQLIVLGQRSTNSLLDRLCRDRRIELSGQSPGHDGFVIECLEDQGRQVVIVGGSNDRGVIYGQDALFDLLRREGGGIVIPLVSVRDWPSIAWRGRPHSVLRQHLVPGALDAYIRARLNFTDVRDDPNAKATNVYPARKASMGFPAGVPIDSETVNGWSANRIAADCSCTAPFRAACPKPGTTTCSRRFAS